MMFLERQLSGLCSRRGLTAGLHQMAQDSPLVLTPMEFGVGVMLLTYFNQQQRSIL